MKSKKILLMFLMIVTVIMATIKVSYASSCGVEITADKSNYAPGQTVVLTIALKDIESTSGIYGLQGIFSYDTDVFEKIDIHWTDDQNDMLNGTSTSLKGLNGWGTPTYNPNDGSISVMILGNVKTKTNIMQIELKVKEGAELGKTKIDLLDLTATDGEDIAVANAGVEVNIKEQAETEIPPIKTTPEPEETPDPTPTPTPKSTPTQKPVKTTPTPKSSLPQTGVKDFAIPVIIGAVVISIVAYIAYRKYREF